MGIPGGTGAVRGRHRAGGGGGRGDAGAGSGCRAARRARHRSGTGVRHLRRERATTRHAGSADAGAADSAVPALERGCRAVRLRHRNRWPPVRSRPPLAATGHRHGGARTAGGARRVLLCRPPGGDGGDGAPGTGGPYRRRAGGTDCHPAPHGPDLRRADLRRAGPRIGAVLPLRRAAGAAHRGGPRCPQSPATAVHRATPRHAAGVALAARIGPHLDRNRARGSGADAAPGALGSTQQGTRFGQGMGRVRVGACVPFGTCRSRRRSRARRRVGSRGTSIASPW